MAAAQHKLSRRAVLAGACALPLARHCEERSDAAIQFGASTVTAAGLLRSARNDEKWRKALGLFAQAEAELAALTHTEDDDVYGRALGRHSAALARLLRAPAPDLGAVAGKLDLIVRHHVSELAFGEAAMAALRRDVLRLHRG
jgi:hypothetical protein